MVEAHLGTASFFVELTSKVATGFFTNSCASSAMSCTQRSDWVRELHMKSRRHENIVAARVEECGLFGLWTMHLWQGGSVAERAIAVCDIARAHREFLEAEVVATKNVEGANDGGSVHCCVKQLARSSARASLDAGAAGCIEPPATGGAFI